MLRTWPRSFNAVAMLKLLRYCGWTAYIPIVGGSVCILIGAFRFPWFLFLSKSIASAIAASWEFFLYGFIAIAIGILEVLAHNHTRKILERHK